MRELLVFPVSVAQCVFSMGCTWFPESLCGMQTPWQPLESDPTVPGAPEITVLKSSGSFELGTHLCVSEPTWACIQTIGLATCQFPQVTNDSFLRGLK